MSDERNYDEIQSKTVLLEDNDGVNDMLSALNTGREAMDKKRKEKERAAMIKKVAIVFAIAAVAVVATLVVQKLF
jgi:hypothetical protein